MRRNERRQTVIVSPEDISGIEPVDAQKEEKKRISLDLKGYIQKKLEISEICALLVVKRFFHLIDKAEAECRLRCLPAYSESETMLDGVDVSKEEEQDVRNSIRDYFIITNVLCELELQKQSEEQLKPEIQKQPEVQMKPDIQKQPEAQMKPEVQKKTILQRKPSKQKKQNVPMKPIVEKPEIQMKTNAWKEDPEPNTQNEEPSIQMESNIKVSTNESKDMPIEATQEAQNARSFNYYTEINKNTVSRELIGIGKERSEIIYGSSGVKNLSSGFEKIASGMLLQFETVDTVKEPVQKTLQLEIIQERSFDFQDIRKMFEIK